MVVRDNRTGQTFQVDPNNAQQMAQYGIQPAGAAALQSKNITTPIAQGISAQAGADVASNTVGADIDQKKGQATLTQAQVSKQDVIDASKAAFDQPGTKGKDGYVSPQTYNAIKQKAVATGQLGADDFDAQFQQSYTNPNNHWYDTKDDRAIQQDYYQTKKTIQGLIDEYNSIPADEKGFISKAQAAGLPMIGTIVAPHAQQYQRQVQGLSASLKSLAGAGTGSGLRVTQTELNRWANLLPSPTNTDEQNAQNLKELNGLIQSSFGKGTGLDPKYLPQDQSNGGDPLGLGI